MAIYNLENNKTLNAEGGWIPALEGLRGTAFLGVFLSHAGVGIQTGAWGVSVFLVLSGFLLCYNHGGSTDSSCLETKKTFFDGIKYALYKLKKLYWLHLVTFMIMLPLVWNNLQWFSKKKTMISISKFILNVCLLHAWIPKSEFYFSFNGVSWYLSVCFFLYIIFYVIKGSLRNDSVKAIIKKMAIVLTAQLSVAIILYLHRCEIESLPMILTDNLTKWITYIFPIYRCGDFLLGIFLGQLYVCNKEKNHVLLSNRIFVSIIQCIPFVLLPCQVLIMKRQSTILGSEAFRYTLLYTLTSLILVWGMCYEGLVSSLMSSGLMRWIGELSTYGFLLHMVIITGIFKLVEWNAVYKWWLALISLVCTLVASQSIKWFRVAWTERKA